MFKKFSEVKFSASSISLRNQLFIALTASKAWVRLSGVSKYPMCKDIRPSTAFKDLPPSFEVARYHSLFALPESLPRELKVTAISDDGVIMGIEHQKLPIAGVQFHPESIMTLSEGVGLKIIKNVVHTYTTKKLVLAF